jgi:hypothetical protein
MLLCALVGLHRLNRGGIADLLLGEANNARGTF